MRILGEIKESQWGYCRHWITLIVMAEAVMLIFNVRLVEIYLAIAAAFAIGFLLRLFKMYPGQDEPLILDFSAVVLGVLFAWIAKLLGPSGWRFLLILCSSAIVVPHFVYIFKEK